MELTRAVMEYAHDNIRVNRVIPGTIATLTTEETVRIRYDAVMTKVPMNRTTPPEEIAAAVVWMGSTRRRS